MPNVIGVDLGRHRSFCSLSAGEQDRLVSLNDTGDTGLWLRWSGTGRSERVTDRILRLAGDDQTAATETAQRVVEALFPELGSGRQLSGTPLVVVPASFGPACRDAVRAGFAGVGVQLDAHHLVDRPLAALAAWVARAPEHAQAGDIRSGIVGLIDNDHGQLSFCAADLDSSRLLVSVPLSHDASDDPADVRARLVEALNRVSRLVAGDAEEPQVHETRSVPAPAIDRLLLSGTRTDDPRLRSLASMVVAGAGAVGAGAVGAEVAGAEVVGAGVAGAEVIEVIGDETTPVLGLLHLDVFNTWSASWPTLDLTLNEVSLAVSYSGLRAGTIHHSDDAPLTAAGGGHIGLAREGHPVALVAGSVHGEGIELPADLGLAPRLRVFDDGRLLVLGAHGSRPVSLRVLWPSPTSPVGEVHVEAVGRRPLVLSAPHRNVTERDTAQARSTAGRPHRATVS